LVLPLAQNSPDIEPPHSSKAGKSRDIHNSASKSRILTSARVIFLQIAPVFGLKVEKCSCPGISGVSGILGALEFLL
jgi:hypothetical protein